ncbi:MAG: thioesterase family protein [Phycisphaeraceae bacterium]
MAEPFILRRRAEFSDTDMAGIVHFAQFFKYMEAAEHAMFRAVGLSIVTEIAGEHVGWPRVHAECDYRSPLRFEEEFDIHAHVQQRRTRSLVLKFHFTRAAGDETIATGSLTTVCVAQDAQRKMRAVAIPSMVGEALAPYTAAVADRDTADSP